MIDAVFFVPGMERTFLSHGGVDRRSDRLSHEDDVHVLLFLDCERFLQKCPSLPSRGRVLGMELSKIVRNNF